MKKSSKNNSILEHANNIANNPIIADNSPMMTDKNIDDKFKAKMVSKKIRDNKRKK